MTPDATVVVHGTVFRVAVSGPTATQPTLPRTCVQVEEGVVSVKTSSAEVFVRAGESWGCATQLEPAAALPLPAEHAAESLPSAGVRPSKPKERETFKAPSGTLDEENALFQAGLSAERQGNARAATTSFELLLARYPASPLAADARGALARVKRSPNTPP